MCGPRAKDATAGAALIRLLQRRTAFAIGSLRNTLPICHVSNMARAAAVLPTSSEPEVHAFLVADGPPQRLRDIRMTRREAWGVNRRILSVPYPVACTSALLLEAVSLPFGR